MELFLDDNGKEVPAYAGLYTMADGKIRINLNAYSGTKGLTLNALSHELTHFIKQWNPDKYKALAEYLIKTYEGTDMTMHKRVVREQNRLKELRKENVSYNEAFDEVVANAFNRLLEDGKVMERIAQIRQMDKSLGDKIIEKIRDFIKRFTNVYKKNASLFRDSEALMEMKEAVDQLQEMFAEALVEASDNFRTADKSGAAKNGKQFSEQQTGYVNQSAAGGYDYTKPFADQLTDFQHGKIPAKDALVVGGTPSVLQKIGLINVPMTINQKHVSDALNGTYFGTKQEVMDHTFTANEFATLPDKIADPVAIIHDKRTGKAKPSESNIDVLVEMTVASGKQVLAAIQVNGNGHINGIRIDTNKVATVHGNTDSIARLVDAISDYQKGNVSVFYINNKKTTKVLQSAGNPIPRGLSNLDGFIHSISDPGSPVKMRITSVTESQQFKRWFGDWQNHLENASKVVNADGTPKVMYHGTNSAFTTFDKRKSKTGAFGKGFYFAPTANRAKMYGSSHIMETYLKIKNPYIVNDSIGFTLEDYRNLQKQFGIQDKITDNNIHKVLQSQKYDGIIVYDEKGNMKEAIAFEPTQIKSATDNIGTFDGGNPDIRYSTQQTDNISDRELLANAFENLAQNSEEYKRLQEYKDMASTLTRLDRELQDINQQIRDISFSKGPRDNDKLARLEAKADRMLKDIYKYDKQLLNMEKAAPLRQVVEMEKKKSRKKTLEHVDEILQNKKERAERAALRQKIRRAVRDLNKILTKGNKQHNVKEGMKGFASKALELADFLFPEHISDDDLIRQGITVRMEPKKASLVKETKQILSNIVALPIFPGRPTYCPAVK